MMAAITELSLPGSAWGDGGELGALACTLGGVRMASTWTANSSEALSADPSFVVTD